MGRGNLDRIQKTATFFCETFPNCFMINIITRDTLLVLAGLTATSLPEEFCSSLATPSHWRIESNSSKYLLGNEEGLEAF